MAKDPAMLWYWNDWNSGTVTMTRHVKGCYIDLLHAQFNNGHLSINEIKTVLGSDFSTWPELQKKFKQDEKGLFFNERLELEQNKRKAFAESRRENRKKTSKTYDATYDKHMMGHMENRNIDIDIHELSSKVFAFLKRKGSNTMEITDMVNQWHRSGITNILGQLTAMRKYYDSNDWPFPTKIETLTNSFPGTDWIERLKDSDPERKAERKANGNITGELPALAPANKPGALDV